MTHRIRLSRVLLGALGVVLALIWVYRIDRRKGERIARQVQAGAVCVNDSQVNYMAIELPQSGWKTSGVGLRHGGAGRW